MQSGVMVLVLRLSAALVALAAVLPIGYLLIRGFASGPALWEQLARIETLLILGRTAALVVGVGLGSMVLALPLAILTTQTDLPWRRFWAVATALPLAIPSYVGALVVVTAFGPRGLLQQWIEPFTGIDRLPEIYGYPGAVLTLTFLTYPYMLLILRAALLGLDPVLEEASRSLGSGPWRTFARVTVPQLAPAMGAGWLLVALYTLSDFGAVSLLRFEPFTTVIYIQYQSSFDRTLAAGLALVLSALAVLILVMEGALRRRAAYHRVSVGSGRSRRPAKLGRWRWVAFGYCSAVLLLALVLPLGVLTFWMVRGLLVGEPIKGLWNPAWNSMLAASLAAPACLVAALPVAVLAVRSPGRFSAVVERAAYLGYGLPGIVVALSLVFFASRSAPALYQTGFLLIFAYVLMFLAQAVGPIRASMLQVRPSLEEAGRSLGRSQGHVLWTVTLPMIGPGLVGGAALTFLAVMKELPVTLLLAPTGFQTLATKTWGASDSGFFARAAAPALALVLLTAFPMAFLLRENRSVPR
ncbi:iron ABC transporter permease [soil metagenome]